MIESVCESAFCIFSVTMFSCRFIRPKDLRGCRPRLSRSGWTDTVLIGLPVGRRWPLSSGVCGEAEVETELSIAAVLASSSGSKNSMGGGESVSRGALANRGSDAAEDVVVQLNSVDERDQCRSWMAGMAAVDGGYAVVARAPIADSEVGLAGDFGVLLPNFKNVAKPINERRVSVCRKLYYVAVGTYLVRLVWELLALRLRMLGVYSCSRAQHVTERNFPTQGCTVLRLRYPFQCVFSPRGERQRGGTTAFSQ